MNDKVTLEVRDAKEEVEIPEAKQSANVLFKFMNKIDYLKEILSNRAIAPRYYEESIEYLEIDKLKKIVFPMICFCDINVSRLSEHVGYYGQFGIGLNKNWGIRNGIQCINYINSNSAIRKDFTHIFNKAMNEENLDSNIDEYNNFLLSNLLFMKPIAGQMLRNGKYDNKNFTDEKEWRYVPQITEEDKIQLIIPPIYSGNPIVYNTYSEAIKKLKHLWLNFKYDDIEYIMVSNKNDRKELIDFLIKDNILNCSDTEKYELISKIIVYNVINKDW
ncbi:MAG: hypothetical protein IJH39_06195 [Clostridia bacterium]|nr:hypothetical protein [Clostridia bacterium]